MSIIMFMTISLGMLSNYLFFTFLHIDQPLVRYPLTAAISYVWFFIMIKIYMKYHEYFDSVDAVDIPDLSSSSGSGTRTPTWEGGGGEFSGGGSSGSFVSSTKGSSSSGNFDVGVDDEASLAILVVGIIAAAIFGSSVYVIWHSPEILSEILIEVFLVARLGKTIRKKNDPEWMMHILKSTGLAFAFVLITCLIGGAVLQTKCPEAKRLSDISRTCSFK